MPKKEKLLDTLFHDTLKDIYFAEKNDVAAVALRSKARGRHMATARTRNGPNPSPAREVSGRNSRAKPRFSGWSSRRASGGSVPQSQSAGTASRPSRYRPPVTAAAQAAMAPSKAAAPAMNAKMTALLRARLMSCFARAATSSTRRSASGAAVPVAAAMSLAR